MFDFHFLLCKSTYRVFVVLHVLLQLPGVLANQFILNATPETK